MVVQHSIWILNVSMCVCSPRRAWGYEKNKTCFERERLQRRRRASTSIEHVTDDVRPSASFFFLLFCCFFIWNCPLRQKERKENKRSEGDATSLKMSKIRPNEVNFEVQRIIEKNRMMKITSGHGMWSIASGGLFLHFGYVLALTVHPLPWS